MTLRIGIDVGTSHCKAAVYDEAGAELALASVPTPWRRVPTGAEADPEELAAAAFSAARRALEEAPAGRVEAVGVTSMVEAGVLLDRAGRPLRPVIAWHDSRGSDAALRLADELPSFGRTTGLAPTAVATIAKHAELGLEGAARWLSVAEWVVRRLGGEETAELSMASRTGYLDVASRAWWEDALAWAGAPAGLLPALSEAGAEAGRCGGELGARAAGAVLAVCGHDHLCAAVGAGATGDGDLFDSCGTAEALVRAVPPPLSAEQLEAAVASGLSAGWHVVRGRQVLIGGFPSGKLLAESDDRAVVERLAERAAGFRSAIERLAGPSTRLVAAGGWTRHQVFAEVKRRVLGPFELCAEREAGCRGAALLAGC